ncbi:MAG: hypothetical protein HYX24_00640 [Candidatus Aenigmarchaeota archaeon]|nr:hypothetical protein [Candidatus Aenigmarchaeota archaeon]
MIFDKLPLEPSSEKGPHRLIALGNSPDSRVYVRPVLGSKELPSRFVGHERYNLGELLSPESLDLPLTAFYDGNRGKLKFPVKVNPREYVIGESDLQLKLERFETACMETRSADARSGIVSPGFLGSSLFLSDSNEKIRVYIVNHTQKTIVIEEPTYENPFAPVSVTVATDGFAPKGELKVANGPQIAGIERYRNIKGLGGHVLTLASDIWIMKKDGGREMTYNDLKQHADEFYEKGKIADIDDWCFPYCLTISNEITAAEGCAGYVFPLHIDDIEKLLNHDVEKLLNHDDSSLFGVSSSMIAASFWNGSDAYGPLCITSNAGLIHAGSNNRTVFETPMSLFVNSSTGYNEDHNSSMKRRLQVDRPFACLVQIPVLNIGQTYNGRHKYQMDINI